MVPLGLRPELGLRVEHDEQPGDVAAAGRREERVDDLPGRGVRPRRRRLAQADPAAGPAGQHLRGGRAAAQDRRDRVERDLEHVVEDKRHPLRGSEGVHDNVQREADGIGDQCLLLGIGPPGPGRLARERADAELERLLGPYATPAQSIEADPPGHDGEPAAQVLDTPAAGAGKAQPRLLPDVIRVRMRAEHAERDRVEIGAMGLELGGEPLFSHGPPPRGGVTTRTDSGPAR